MKIVECEGGQGLPEGFAELPAAVYAADPMWIPEDPAETAFAFSSANPWFRAGRARTLSIPGRARVAVFCDPRTVIEGRPAAFFGYWESIGDPEAEAALMARACDWAREQQCETLYGPINFSTALAYRLRIGAEPGAIPFPGEPYNPVAYPSRLLALGFTEHQRYLTQVGTIEQVRATRDRRRQVARRVLARGYRVQTLTPAEWLARLPELYPLVDAIFRENFAYTPIPYEAFALLLGQKMVARMCPHTSVLALTPNGEVGGVCILYPSYGPLCVQGAGAQRVPAAAINYAEHEPLLRGRGPVGWILKTIGVAPPFRRRGLTEAMVVEAFDRAEGRFDYLLGALIREDNASRNIAPAYGGERTYVLYQKSLLT
jgi:hypothetical protein